MRKLSEVLTEYYAGEVLPAWDEMKAENPGVGQHRLICQLSVVCGVGPKVLKRLVDEYERAAQDVQRD